jgi:hypothetical protein
MPIDLEKVQSELMNRLPKRARWFIANGTWDWDFSRARQRMRPLTVEEVSGWAIPIEWGAIYLFGEQDFSTGGGASPFVGIHIETGQICGLDVERDDGSSVYLFNTSVSQFIEVFLLLNSILSQQVPLPNDLAERIQKADPEAFTKSEWRDAVKYMKSGSD